MPAKAGTPTQQLLWSPGSPGERILEAYDRQEKQEFLSDCPLTVPIAVCILVYICLIDCVRMEGTDLRSEILRFETEEERRGSESGQPRRNR